MAYYAVIRDPYFLMHHGILGQKWGVRNGPPYPLERQAGKPHHRVVRTDIGRKNMERARTSNIEKWGKSPNTNVLYVTGYSGSGKSTLAQSFSDKNTSAIHLDSYTDQGGAGTNKAFDAYLNKHYPDYVKLKWPKDKISINDWGKVCERFEEEIENFGKSEYKRGRKVICEGVQLLDDTIRPDKSFFKDKPMAITTTSAIVSNHRANQRDEYKYDGIRDIVSHIKWYGRAHKEMKEIIKQTGAKRRRSK